MSQVVGGQPKPELQARLWLLMRLVTGCCNSGTSSDFLPVVRLLA